VISFFQQLQPDKPACQGLKKVAITWPPWTWSGASSTGPGSSPGQHGV